jgi:hypothetical protein
MIDMKERGATQLRDLSSNKQQQKTAVTNLIFVVAEKIKIVVAQLVTGSHHADRLH